MGRASVLVRVQLVLVLVLVLVTLRPVLVLVTLRPARSREPTPCGLHAVFAKVGRENRTQVARGRETGDAA